MTVKMPKIDWVEIPAGQFFMGLSAQQLADLKSRLPEDKFLEENFYTPPDMKKQSNVLFIWIRFTSLVFQLPMNNMALL
jgi:hypothetical protein